MLKQHKSFLRFFSIEEDKFSMLYEIEKRILWKIYFNMFYKEIINWISTFSYFYISVITVLHYVRVHDIISSLGILLDQVIALKSDATIYLMET